MKKSLFVFIVSFCLLGCGPDCGPLATPELNSVNASLSTADTEGREPLASDLRLNLSLGVIYVSQLPVSLPFIDRAYACSPALPSGFDNEVVELSLTCDKALRGFDPGENVLTTSSDVFEIWWDDTPSYTSITLGQWLDLINKGRTRSLSRGYANGDSYDVSIAFIPEGTEVATDDYTFTLTLKLQNGKRYVISPMTVAL